MELLEHIQWQYFCCVPIRDIEWKNFFNEPLTWLEQEALLNYTIDNEIIITNQNRHVPRSYSLAFFRSIISKLESNNSVEIYDKLYEHYVNLLNDTTSEEKNYNNHNLSFAYRHFKIHDLPKTVGLFISIKESEKIISNGTTGLRSWQAAGALAEFAIQNIDIFHGKCILELGAGTGLAGLVIAKCCQPKTVIMTDGNMEVMKLLESNIECNFPTKTNKITSEFLNWDSVDNLVNISKFHKPDLLIAADVVYDPDLFDPLLNVIRYFFEHTENPCRLIMACTERNVETLCQFTDKLEKTFTILFHDTIKRKHLYWDNSTPIKIFSCLKKN